MFFNAVSDHSELSRKPLNHLLAGSSDPKTLDPDTRPECQEEFPERPSSVQEETLKKVLETAKSPESSLAITEERRPPKEVQGELTEADQLFQTDSLQQHQGKSKHQPCYLLMSLGHSNLLSLCFGCVSSVRSFSDVF